MTALVEKIPAPTGDADAPLQALIFDSFYDAYRGVISSVRVMNGELSTGSRLKFIQADTTHDADEVVCVMTPEPFHAVGLWYDDFAETSDDEVRELLRRAAAMGRRAA